ncbi:MaoC family dehydratase [Conexibacter sp. CPCC 206217]|uniref:MaoC family dehydratase n=1 Tax=Conexibacter sp. CPCC 206217 TaxID=3064574 RepID=UPI00271D506C|nr:MaoC family dehydratase [Conexibacter sp. CPCC 206217]MDO8212450.1 MaoC family dehydratase [Conexibacter sp. CPCC 206217]
MTTWAPFPELARTIDQAAIDSYAELSGDRNPLHVDPEYAATGPFGGIVAHGPIGLQTIFDAVARWLGHDRLPPGVVVDVALRGPVRAGDTVTCRATADPLDHAAAVTLPLVCTNQRGEEILQALVIAPRGLVPRG